jgi:hypothetical protein
MTADVITLREPLNNLTDRIRAAFARTERGREEWIEGTLELAACLAEGRARFIDDRQFSAWLAQNELDHLGRDDRAALLGMARDLALARLILQETKRVSWRWIWLEEMQSRFRQVAKLESDISRAEIPTVAAAVTLEAKEKSVESTRRAEPVSARSPFFGLERADEVSAVYACGESRTVIGRAAKARGGKELWSLILASIDAGLLTRTESVFSKLSLRILVPDCPKSFAMEFDLGRSKDRQRVRDEIMPAAMLNREAVIAEPHRLPEILTEHRTRQAQASRDAAAKQRLADAVRTMPAEQQEIVMFGERLWPRVEHQFGTYDYDQICAAIWYFRDLDGWVQGGLSGKTPGSRAIIARLSTRWPQEYIDRALSPDTRGKIKKVYQLVHLLARLLEENPEGECVVPPTPKIEGQW